jgi:hypothetical protein
MIPLSHQHHHMQGIVLKNRNIYIAGLCVVFVATSGCSDDSPSVQNIPSDLPTKTASSDAGTDTQVVDVGSDLDEVPECNLGFADCTAAPGCETSETDPAFFFYEDSDDDGFGDAMTMAFFCDAAAAALVMVNPVQDNTDCDDASALLSPGAEEVCDGRDNNCDGFDDAAPQASAPIQGVGDVCNLPALGACGISANVCSNINGIWALACPQTATPGAEACNGLDDDCDGSDDTVDPDVSDGTNSVGDACTRPTTQFDGSINLCAAGTYSCVSGVGDVPLTCVQVVQPVAEAPGFDGIDSNCDGYDQ